RCDGDPQGVLNDAGRTHARADGVGAVIPRHEIVPAAEGDMRLLLVVESGGNSDSRRLQRRERGAHATTVDVLAADASVLPDDEPAAAVGSSLELEERGIARRSWKQRDAARIEHGSGGRIDSRSRDSE